MHKRKIFEQTDACPADAGQAHLNDVAVMEKIQLNNWKISGGVYSDVPARVPGDVTADLFRVGLIPDPLWGQNLKDLKPLFETDWTYSCAFEADKALLRFFEIFLVFEGIDTLAEVTLNGIHIGSTDNMFREWHFSVKDLLKEGKNVLHVCIRSSLNAAREKNDGKDRRALFNAERAFLRKAQFHFGWDWAPPLIGCGLWLPAYIEAFGSAHIGECSVRPYNDGNVSFRLVLSGELQDCTVVAEAAGVRTECAADGRVCVLNLRVQAPELWWPNGYGEQPLYAYSVSLYKKGELLYRREGRFAFREITVSEEPIAKDRLSFALMVNGRRIFAKGSNWVPVTNMTGLEETERYTSLLRFAKEGGYNILRVWGGGIYEKDIFYDLCDELGILVWQDFAFACSAIPADIPGIEQSFLQEAEYQIKRLRGHPSLALWCGGNEYAPDLNGTPYEKGNALIRIRLRGLVGELDPCTPYIHNSPCGVHGDEWDFRSGDSHIACQEMILRKNDIRSFRKYIAMYPSQFVSECTVLGSSRLRSLKKFIPAEELWPAGESWEYHFMHNPHLEVPEETFFIKEKRLAAGLFGNIETVQGFVKKSMLAQAELMRAELDFARMNKHCAGFMNWMYNDVWGCGTWSVIDYYGEKKAAYYVQKRAFAPIYLGMAWDGDVKIFLANDTKRTLTATVRFGAKTLGGELLHEAKQTVSVCAGDTVSIPFSCKMNGDYLFACCRAGGKDLKTIYFHELWDQPFRTDLSYSVKEQCSGRYLYTLSIKANAFARCVFIDHPLSAELIFSDNYFDMEAGERRCIKVYSEKRLDKEAFHVKTYADEWED